MDILRVGQRVALLIWNESDEDAYVSCGTLDKVDGCYQLVDERGNCRIKILDEWLCRVEVVPVDLKELFLESEIYIPLLMGDLSECESDNDF